jgi:hypothetical protein
MSSEALQRNAKHEARLQASQFLDVDRRQNDQRFFSRDCGIRMTINGAANRQGQAHMPGQF